MWVRRGVSPADDPDDQHRGPDVTLYHYSSSRSGSVAAELLQGYTGAIITDAYAGYDKVEQSYGLQHGHCWAHARRKFVEAEKALPKANGLAPYRYLKWVFEQLPLAKTETNIDKLLPWNIEPDTIG
jgi:hypothetical protein